MFATRLTDTSENTDPAIHTRQTKLFLAPSVLQWGRGRSLVAAVTESNAQHPIVPVYIIGEREVNGAFWYSRRLSWN